uniref:Leucine-rich repeat-containing N-terminal plant-type domain-containing protein n=1 Tax=Odontella aurita TaxID=265563 RepID=A0A7S4JQG1_9STRA|mmetsp:Transcript_51130/g.153632  ORF Transcript_51130/g.153632 Transcript_51130/m.153632 type:complete len:780 (+) Transcript_51130:192-2531(+)
MADDAMKIPPYDHAEDEAAATDAAAAPSALSKEYQEGTRAEHVEVSSAPDLINDHELSASMRDAGVGYAGRIATFTTAEENENLNLSAISPSSDGIAPSKYQNAVSNHANKKSVPEALSVPGNWNEQSVRGVSLRGKRSALDRKPAPELVAPTGPMIDPLPLPSRANIKTLTVTVPHAEKCGCDVVVKGKHSVLDSNHVPELTAAPGPSIEPSHPSGQVNNTPRSSVVSANPDRNWPQRVGTEVTGEGRVPRTSQPRAHLIPRLAAGEDAVSILEHTQGIDTSRAQVPFSAELVSSNQHIHVTVAQRQPTEMAEPVYEGVKLPSEKQENAEAGSWIKTMYGWKVYLFFSLVLLCIAIAILVPLALRPRSTASEQIGEFSTTLVPSIQPTASMPPSFRTTVSVVPTQVPSQIPSFSSHPSSSFVPSMSPSTANFAEVKMLLVSVMRNDSISTSPASLEDTASPQYEALMWVTEKDDRQVNWRDDMTSLVQRFVLATIYFATGGDAWDRKFTFLSADHECTWGNVFDTAFCGDGANIETISLGYNNLNGSIPEELGLLKSLKVITLSGNHLTGHLPTSIRNLINLEVLSLHANDLSGSLPFGKENLRLQDLDVSSNFGFTGTIPREMFSYANLSSIDLQFNSFSGVFPPSDIGNLMKLKKVRVGANSFAQSPIPSVIGSLKGLTYLGLDRNEFSGAFPDFICKLSGLITVKLNSNRLSGTLPACIEELTNLREFFISRNKLKGTLPDVFASIAKLSMFNIDANQFSGPIPASLAQLEDLSK